jgi:hypothetical protein
MENGTAHPATIKSEQAAPGFSTVINPPLSPPGTYDRFSIPPSSSPAQTHHRHHGGKVEYSIISLYLNERSIFARCLLPVVSAAGSIAAVDTPNQMLLCPATRSLL